MDTFHKKIEYINPEENFERYCVNESENVIVDAFSKKSAVHAGLMDKFAPKEQTQEVLKNVLNQERNNRTAAYIHVPFCETHCLYCGFYNQPYRKEQSRIYTDVLIQEIKLWENTTAFKTKPINALYFGGGTPTALEVEDISRLLTYIRNTFPLANDCEITMEGRISNMTRDKVEAYLQGGVNRFSLGVQSFNTDLRRSMGRRSDRDTIIERINMIKEYNQAAVVLDLIYGFPNQTMDIWVDDIKLAQSLEIDGFDCYQLNVFPNTPLGKRIADGSMNPALNVKEKTELFIKSVELMQKELYTRISVNHWQRTTRERNIYNRLARGYASCLSFGAGAGGNINGHSYMILRDYQGYLAAVKNGVKPIMGISIPGENYSMYKEISEYFETGYLDLAYLENKYNLPLTDICSRLLKQWENAGVIKYENNKIILTLAGQFWFVNLSQLLQEYIKLTLQFNSSNNLTGEKVSL